MAVEALHRRIKTPTLPAVRVEGELERILERATEGVRPSDRLIRFYNWIGRLPLRLGAFLLALSSPQGVRFFWRVAVRRRTDAGLQILYNYQGFWSLRPWNWAAAVFLESYNCRSVRSRGRFVQEAVRFLLGYLARERAASDGHGRGLVVVSLGSGSASQLLQGFADNGFAEDEAHIVLVDRDPRALRAGRSNAQRLGLEAAVEAFEGTIGQFLRRAAPESVDFFEMVGLADYFKDHQLRRYLRGVYAALRPGGFFLGANISSREEADYAHGAACWPRMFYRSQEQLVQMLKQAGFQTIWTGACGLYTVWVARK